MAKKNFDDFINSAGKKPKLTPEEVEVMAKQLHQPIAQLIIAKEKPVAPKERRTSLLKKSNRSAEPVEASKEKVRITIDLAKDLYKRMKLSVVQNETEISAYIRMLIEKDLNKN